MKHIGFACAYTPVVLIDAAGFAPYRILPMTEAADQAGMVMHDNLCPHVKRILDRAMSGDLPHLEGTVLVNSCDSMRRLADGWRTVRPDDKVVLVDLPATLDDRAIVYFAGQLAMLRETLAQWAGRAITDGDIGAAIDRWNRLAASMDVLRNRQRRGTLVGGAAAMQRVVNEISTRSVGESLESMSAMLERPEQRAASGGVPILVFGNVLPDPAVLDFFEECGARIVADDLCTGSRLVSPVKGGDDVLAALARSLLERPICARTLSAAEPGKLGRDVVKRARDAGARAVIGHTMKFCDPYLARMPAVREACEKAGLPLLVLEGDCTMMSVGQQSTRIEAFIEMIG
jgi:benzoyl-CoA reductase/2-hydroxyglutaryl-CoA dehydratase subunit BcrC/BadD/HgdB